MKIGAIIQARMSSHRLPNKVLYEVGGKPMLQYTIERLERCDCLDNIAVATSVDSSDTAVADFCHRYGIACHRGSLDNVAGRFVKVLDRYGFDGFVRINGDSPLLDQRLVDRAVDIYRSGDFDLVTNVMPRTYPKGQSVEVLRTLTFREVCSRMDDNEEREHVTPYYHKHPEEFRICSFTLPENLNHIQLSVDTRQDMDNFIRIVAEMVKPHWEYKLEDIIQIYRRLSPSLSEISSFGRG